MAKKTIGGLIMIMAAIAGGGAWIYYSHSQPGPSNILGYGVAEETARLLGNKGQVMIIAPDTTELEYPSVKDALNLFQKTLNKKGMTVATTVKFKLTPIERMATGGVVPRDQFLNALQSHANPGAIILFCGFPQLAKEDYDILKQSGAKVVVASGYIPRYTNLLKAQVIDLAIVPQFDGSAASSKKPRTPLERFESEFVVITSSNAGNVPERQ